MTQTDAHRVSLVHATTKLMKERIMSMTTGSQTGKQTILPSRIVNPVIYKYNEDGYYSNNDFSNNNIVRPEIKIIDIEDYYDINITEYYQKSKQSEYVGPNFKQDINIENIPKYLNIEGRNKRYQHSDFDFHHVIKMGDIYNHTHTFSRICKGHYGPAHITDNVQSCMMPSFILPINNDYSAIYFKIDNTHNNKISAVDCYVIATNYGNMKRRDILMPVSILDIFEDMSFFNKIIDYNFKYSKEEIFKLLSSIPIPTFAANYHENIAPEDMNELLEDKYLYKLGCVNLHSLKYLGRAGLIGIILWINSVNEDMLRIVLSHNLFKSKTVKSFIDICKHISDKSKFLQNICCINLMPLFEIQCLVNRISTPIDWEKEKENRTNPRLAKIPTEFIISTMKRIFSNKLKISKNKYKTIDWQEFWDTRYEWAPPGADFSQYEEDQKYRSKNSFYKNKIITLCSMPNNLTMDYFYRRKPCSVAKASVKYEWAKERAIYGCDITNFVMFQFAMGNCEEYFDRRFSSGKNSATQYVNSRLKTILQFNKPLCLDYEDFNSHHSFDSMKAVLYAFRSVYDKFMSDDQKEAFDWCYASMEDQKVIQKIVGHDQYYTKGTLFSGWRLTSFMNSALNYCYYEYINPGITQSNSNHSGDDIICGISKHSYYRDINYNAIMSHIRFSPGKCHYGSVSEFLRVDHKSKETGQYLCRSIATYVFSRIETDPAYDIKDVIESYVTRGASCIARGGNNNMFQKLTTSAIIRKNNIITQGHIPVEIIMEQSRVCGGLSDLKVSRYLYDISKLGLWKLRELGKLDEMELPEHYLCGIKSYANYLKKRFFEYKFSASKLEDKLYETLIYSYARISNRFVITKLSDRDIRKRKIWHAIKGAHSNVIRLVEYGRAKAIGILIQVINSVMEAKVLLDVVAGETDKLDVLSKII